MTTTSNDTPEMQAAQKIVDIAYRDNLQCPHRDTIAAIISKHIKPLREALKNTSLWKLRDGTVCWCLYAGQGDLDHTPKCLAARAVVAGEGVEREVSKS